MRFDATGRHNWSFTREDAAAHFPLIYAAGILEPEGQRLLVANSDWHYPWQEDNHVQLFAGNFDGNVIWVLSASAFEDRKRSEVEQRTGLIEHCCCLVQPLP